MATIKTSLPGVGVYLSCTKQFLTQNDIDDYKLVNVEQGIDIILNNDDAVMLRLTHNDTEVESAIAEAVLEHVSNLLF